MPFLAPVRVLGIPVHPYTTLDALHNDLKTLIVEQRHALVLNVNAHAINLAYENTWLRTMLRQAEIVFCDSKGVILGAWLLGQSIPMSIGYGRWIWHLAAFLEAHDYSIYLLGSPPGVAEKAAARLCACYPRLRIVGTHHGFFDKTPNSAESLAVIDDINAARPNLLLVCFGMPLQEEWLLHHWDRIDADLGLTGGAALDYTAGIFPRSPMWITNIGMEWFWRLLFEPARLWRRYLIGNPVFLARILKARFGGVDPEHGPGSG